MIEKQYNKMQEEKIKPLIDDEQYEQAISIITSEIQEYESYRKDIIAQLDKSVDSVLDQYTKAIEKRIDKPGFVFNVELSDKGKGELNAKWQELISVQKLKLDEYKMKVAASAGLTKLNNMIAKMKGFVEEKKYSSGKTNLDFYVQKIGRGSRDGDFVLQIELRAPATRLKVKEKGILWSKDEDHLDIKDPGARHKSHHEHTFRVYNITIQGIDESYFVRPYVTFLDSPAIHYGEIDKIESLLAKQEKIDTSKI